jgi:hypothetical protein
LHSFQAITKVGYLVCLWWQTKTALPTVGKGGLHLFQLRQTFKV